MRLAFFSCVLLLWTAAAQAQSVSEFQLPPDPESTATSRPQPQGPTDTEGQTRTAPRVINTASPTPRPTTLPSPRATEAPAPTATPSPRPGATRASPQSLPATERPVATREVLSEPAPPTEAATPNPQPESAPAETTQSDIAGVSDDPVSSLPSFDGDPVLPSTDTSQDEGNGFSIGSLDRRWTWGGAALAALLALVAAAKGFRRRRGAARTASPAARIVPDGEPLQEVTGHSFLGKTDEGSLEVEAYATALSRSVMNATVAYRISFVNRGREAISLIQVHGDVTTAHGQVPTTQQLADTEQAFPELHQLARLEPGQRSVVRGELRLPLSEVRALRQGNVPVFVPLLRLTVRAANLKPRAYTYVIGAKPLERGARPNPFRLDEGPRSYGQLTTRALA